jgi:hypothetical protein
VSPRPVHIRELIEAALDEIRWTWCRRLSLLLDELIAREEQRGDA